jgi:hypothetical protein
MDAREEIRIQHEIADNEFFHDFLLFLQEAGRQPFRLTARGNLRLADIHYFGEHFKQDIYHRDIDGYRWHVRSETDVPALRRIRLLAAHMRLTETRQRQLLLSIRGKGYLADTSPERQFEQLVLWYLQRYDWTEWYTYRAVIAAALQQSQRFLWRYFLYRKDTKIDFSRFLAGVREYFGLDALTDESYFSDSVRWAVEQVLVSGLRLFGLLSVDSVNRGNFITDETFYSFQPTTLGAHIFWLALTQQGKEDGRFSPA